MKTLLLRLSPILLLLAAAGPLAAVEPPAPAPANLVPPAACAPAVPWSTATGEGEGISTGVAKTGELFVQLSGVTERSALAAAAVRFPSAGCFCASTCRPLYICNCSGPGACCTSCCFSACR
jgi:hypothetical protein